MHPKTLVNLLGRDPAWRARLDARLVGHRWNVSASALRAAHAGRTPDRGGATRRLLRAVDYPTSGGRIAGEPVSDLELPRAVCLTNGETQIGRAHV